MSEVAHGENQENAVQSAAGAEVVAEQLLVNNSAAAVAGDPTATDAPQEAAAAAVETPPKKTPTKRTPSKRMSFIERAQKESEELVKTMGGTLEMEGGRRTRSSARGTPTAAVITPPPAKKARTSSNSPSPRGGRGRAPRKLDTDESPKKKGKGKSATPTPEKVESVKSDELEKPSGDKPADEKSEGQTEATAAESVPAAPATDAPAVTKPSTAAELVAEKTETANDEEKVEPSADAKNSSAAESLSEDKLDAPLEPIQEEKTNDAEDVIKNSEEPSKTADSPMETDEIPSEPAAEAQPAASQSKPTKLAAPALQETAEKIAPVASSPAAASAAREPTPEPMEVDSSSKSSDVIETTDQLAVVVNDFQRLDDDVIEVQTPQTNSSSSSVVEVPTTQPEQASNAEPVAAAVPEKQNNAPIVVENSAKSPQGVHNVVDSVAAKLAPAAEAIVNSFDLGATGEPKAVAASTNEHKSANDFSEPKIASPSMPATNDGGAPQYCN